MKNHFIYSWNYLKPSLTTPISGEFSKFRLLTGQKLMSELHCVKKLDLYRSHCCPS